MRTKLAVACLLAVVAAVVYAADREAPAEKKAPQTQTAPAPQTQPQTRDAGGDFRVIEETPKSKNTVTIPTSIGMQDGSNRRYDVYKKLSEPARETIREERRAVDKSTSGSSDTESTQTQPQ